MAAVFSELVTLMLMAFALGMDAFSVGLGMGMLRLRLRQMIKIGLTVGFFHIWMPLLGIFAGRLLSEQFGAIAGYIGGGLLIMLGMQMIWAGLREQETAFITPVGIGLFLFALGVSLDSFSVGLTLGIYGAKTALVLACFGAGATILTWSGLLLGRHVQGLLGSYGEVFGGGILFVFGVKLLFPI